MSRAPPEELSIGIQELDDQHRALYAEIDKLRDAMRAHDLDHAVRVTDYLREYVNVHFATEERLMIEAGYPGFPEHLARHEEFRKDLRAYLARLSRTGATAAAVVELSHWLTEWLREHIRKVDVEMARFLRSRPAR